MKNGQIKVCVDFCNLNKACPKDKFPLPHVDTLVDSTTGHQMSSFIDGISGYNQIKMALEDAENTAFRKPLGNFFYRVMPFNLKNAGATYQRAMTAVFHDMLHHEVEVYVDDLVVKSTEVVTRSDPVRYLLSKPTRTGRMARWLLAIVEYDITYVTLKVIKSQALADKLAQFLCGKHEPAEVPLPREVHVSVVAIMSYWDLKFDGASGAEKGGAGITLTGQAGEKFHLSYKLDFECSNNKAKYEALILGLIAAQKKGLHKLKI
ncbi:uncharacterized protein LOC114262295 [Camellia sinensis]|uniref:uncharacterized protein LOC114262295 n=1 Tax=Camellia sinensis TaxID=4442 RepID=UPI00103589D3|nr:uncharacterized protein LOC114262295 [Camellia sinensis]